VVKKAQPKANDTKEVAKKTITKPVVKKTTNFSGQKNNTPQNKSKPFVQTMQVVKKDATKPTIAKNKPLAKKTA
jgi:hypothetical protein